MTTNSKIIECSTFVDDRGSISYCNEVDFSKYKRYYSIQNNHSVAIRGMHGHQFEQKLMMSTRKDVLVVLIPLFINAEDKIQMSENPKDIERYVLSSKRPTMLVVPPMYANGFKMLDPKATLMVFSSASLDESKNDDYRYSPDLLKSNPFDIAIR